MSKAVGYIRVSTQGQVRDGYSLAYRRNEIVHYCVDGRRIQQEYWLNSMAPGT